MKTPRFWYIEKSIYYLLLYPFSILWLVLSLIKKVFAIQYKANIPIICIGNIIAGGAGKTPVSIEIANLLKSKGINVHFVYKYYNSNLKKSLTLVKKETSSLEIGDEPVLASKVSSTWVCKKRVIGIKKAEESGADLIILDDGMQDYTIYKDFTVLCINSNQNFGNKKIIPSGPLRETIQSGISKSDCIFYYGRKNQLKKLLPFYKKDIFFLTIIVCKKILKKLKNKKLVAFAGIAHPTNFFNTLEKNNLNIVKKFYFSDHHNYKPFEIKEIINFARLNNATIVTTEKDYAKLTNYHKTKIEKLPIYINFKKNMFFNKMKNQINI